jgi:anthraniloyl-CoA monooxygenase
VLRRRGALGSRAIGGAGLVVTEMTDVTAEGRITTGCAGMYAPEHVAAWRRIVDYVHRHTPARIGIQLAHAGRKGSVRHPWEGDDVPLTQEEGAWETLAPSPVPFREHWPPPKGMDRDDMDAVRDAFVRAAEWAEEAGFDLVELHMAHGYLLSTFSHSSDT